MKLKIDFHVHSHHSFDSVMTYDTIIRTAKERGLDGVCICDHAFCDVSESLANDNDKFIIIPGAECSVGRAHIIGMFLEGCPDVVPDKKSLHVDLEKYAGEVHKNGGICIYAHPYERALDEDKLLPESSMEFLDGIEVYNARAGTKFASANRKALEKADKLGVKCRTAGSDGHLPEEIGAAYCVVDSASRSLKDIKEAILAGKVEIHGRQSKRVYMAMSEHTKDKKMKRGVKRRILTGMFFCKMMMKDAIGAISGRKD